MTQEKINLIELLKDCPKGMELDCTMFDDVKFDSVSTSRQYPICITVGEGRHEHLTEYGEWNYYDIAKCVIFPKGKTTWEGFHRPFVDGDIVAFDNPNMGNLQIFIFKDKKEYNTLSNCYLMLDGDILDLEEGMYYVTRFATDDEKQKLFDVIKANGYEWNAETKTLVKIDKFDIKTLIPFESKVLVRDLKDGAWQPAIFGYYLHDVYPYFMAIGGFRWKYLIPYEGNEHLMGTTDDCAEFYKIWND